MSKMSNVIAYNSDASEKIVGDIAGYEPLGFYGKWNWNYI